MENNANINLIQNDRTGQMDPDFLPTNTIKKGDIKPTIPTSSVRLSSYVPSQGKVGLLTYLNLSTAGLGTFVMSLTDRNGTFDSFRMGTKVGTNLNQVTLQGHSKAPLHTILGTFFLNNHQGSFAIGASNRVSYNWEVIQK